MGVENHKICLLLIMALYTPEHIEGSCALTNLPKVNVCVVYLQCEQVINFDTDSKSCMPFNDYSDEDYDYRIYEMKTQYKDYELYVNVKNADDEHGINLRKVHNLFNNIKQIQINDGNLLAVPYGIYELSEATDIEITNNQISVIALNRFVKSFEKLSVINFRNNTISSFENDMRISTSWTSASVKTIDLSQNLLVNLPNTSFSIFTELQHLNLSHNKIISFDILSYHQVMKLTTLDVSHNMLFEIGNSFRRYVYLEELYLQNNKFKNLFDYNFSSLHKLNTLNLSSNMIDTCENNTFKNLIMLEYLDLSYNKLENISKFLFEHNENLHSVLISNNRINHVDNGTFFKKNITEFNIQSNILTGSIEKDTFLGVHVTELDISNGSISSFGVETFKYMCQDLKYLNASFNMIKSISHSSFNCLEQLLVLDLSHNHIEELDFATDSLIKLTKLYVHYNNIKKITKNVYNNLISLETLDLSHNEITQIELSSFLGLQNINALMVKHNPFVNILENNTFDGLVALTSIDLSFTRTVSYLNRSFSGLRSLKHINASFGQLYNIEYNAFIQTGSIEKLDLSHNLLKAFHINTSSISTIEEINLNDNELRHISNDTFFGLKLLRMLNLVNNNIQRMEAGAFRNVLKLSHLYLSSNVQMEIIGNPFDNLTNLYEVNLDNVKTKFTFQGAISIENLDLHSCGISDLNELSIDNVGSLYELNLSSNKISKLDKFSFKDMSFLISLDLSLNKISFIQPGTFLHVGGLSKLSLYGNNLQMLQFGVFDGIKALHYLNLSSNALQSFDPKLLPDALSVVTLDNNVISSLNFKEFFESGIKKLSIGGNPISCKVLVDLRTYVYSQKFKEVVTTATLDFHSENVNGISCQGASTGNDFIIRVDNNTDFDIRPMFIQFSDAIKSLRSSIDTLGNNTAPEKSYQLIPDVGKLVSSIQTLVDISNQTQIKSGDSIPQAKVFENEVIDYKVLYFIAITIGMIMILYIIKLVFIYGYYKGQRKSNNLSSSRTPFSSEIEME